MDELA